MKIIEENNATNLKNFTVYTDCAHFLLDRPCNYQKNNNALCDKCDKYVKVSQPQNLTTILIIKLGAMGDVLRTTFILEGLKQIYPQSEISWLVSEKNAAVLENNPFVDTILYSDEKIIEYLALNYFDTVINLDLSPESLALAKLTNCSKVLGYTLDNQRNILASNTYAEEWLQMSAYDELKKANTCTYQHMMSKIINLHKDNYEIIVRLNKESVQRAEKFLTDNNVITGKKIIGINPGAGKRWSLKKWTTKGFISVAKYFSDNGHPVLLLGGSDDKNEIDAILAEKIKRVYSTGTNNSIPDFFAMINLCDVLLCGDTMALHAALGLGKNIVALFGPTSLPEIETYSRGIKIQSSKECVCCYRQTCDVSENCMESISTSEVINAIETQMATAKNKHNNLIIKTIAMIPTYNECSNIRQIIDGVLNCGIADIEVLIVDDCSPDGTYKIVEEISRTDSRVHLLLRKEKKGRGYAGKDGFLKAIEMGADYVIEMDGDGSHSPKYIPEFFETIKNCDVVIGSRYVNGGKDEERAFIRQIVSNFSRTYLSFILGIKIKDPTSGYRMFTKDALASFADKLQANDPFIVTEVLYHVKKNKFNVKEYPIEFLTRVSGTSKLRIWTLIKYLFKVLKLKVAY